MKNLMKIAFAILVLTQVACAARHNSDHPVATNSIPSPDAQGGDSSSGTLPDATGGMVANGAAPWCDESEAKQGVVFCYHFRVKISAHGKPPIYCETGKKLVLGHEHFCELLSNEAENNHCAKTERQVLIDRFYCGLQ